MRYKIMSGLLLGGTVFASALLLFAHESDAPTLTPEEIQEGFVPLFDGKTHAGWQGDIKGWPIEDGALVCRGEYLYTVKEYGNFVLRFEFKLPPGGNNGIGIRAPREGHPTYAGLEIQILDDSHPKYKDLKPYQKHGSIYGLVPAAGARLKPVGQWNQQEIVADGSRIKVTVNGTVIVDADLSKIEKPLDGEQHPGLHRKSGHIVLLSHGDPVAFRNIRIKELPQAGKE